MSANYPKSSRSKGLPIIVDVAIDNQGKKSYHVHENNDVIQELTPLTIKNCESARLLFDAHNEVSNPPSVSSTQSPFPEQEQVPDIKKRVYLDNSDSRIDDKSRSAASSPITQDDVWSADVEAAFEEALAIIPKCGLNKLKIAGRSFGRNELISDFILAKTGKFRSRKQVSSHIQVVKNLKLKDHNTRLIKDGPDSSSSAEAAEIARRFEEVFTKINLNKSLGFNCTGGTEISGFGGSLRRRLPEKLALPRKRKKLLEPFISIKNISFTTSGARKNDAPISLTMQNDTSVEHDDNTQYIDIISRVPGLEEFYGTPIPILHNMVKIVSPLEMITSQAVCDDLNTNYNIEVNNCSEKVSVFTTVYSFGEEVFRLHDDRFETNSDQPFLVNFWKCFFLQHVHNPTSLGTVLKGMTVKQIIYDNNEPFLSILPKSKIVAIILWEFSKVEEITDALSSSSRLFLPPYLGYPTMFPSSYDHSVRDPQTINTLSQPSLNTGCHHLSQYPPSTSSTSLPKYAQHNEQEIYDPTRNQSDSTLQQLSFPEAPAPFTFSNYNNPVQQQLHGILYNTPLCTMSNDGSGRIFLKDQLILETHYQ